MKTLIINTQLIISMELRKSVVSINIKKTWLNKEKFAKNTFIYQNSIDFSWASVSFKKKVKNTFKSPGIFVFTIMATYKETYKLWILRQNLKKEKKEEAKFINNQLECFFFFFFSSKIKYIYNFPKPKSQTPKDSKRIITFTKSTMSDFNIKTVSYRHWIKNSSLLH